MILRLFFFLLSLDDFQAREILAFFFFKSLGDIFYRLGELRDHNIIERICALLRFLYRVGKAIYAVLYLRELCGHVLDLHEAQISLVEL